MDASRTLRPKFRSPAAIGAAQRVRQKSSGKKKTGKKQSSRCSSEYSTTSSIPTRHRTPSICSSETTSQFEKTMDKLQKQVEENKLKIQDISAKIGSHDTPNGDLEGRVSEVEDQQRSFVARLDKYERSGRMVCRFCNKNLSISYIQKHQKIYHSEECFLEQFIPCSF